MKLLFCFLSSFLCRIARAAAVLGVCLSSQAAAPGPVVSGSVADIPAGSVVNLTSEGEIDWVHWGLFTETSLDRKAGVVPQISDYTLLDAAAGFAFAYQFADNANGYSWTDGTPHAVVNDTTTGVWAYGTPVIDSGFQITAPADTTTRNLKVYVGAFAAQGRFVAFLSDGSARGYTNTSVMNINNGPSAAYSITYAAASANQHLTIQYTLTHPFRPDGNVTLQSATLTATNFNNPPFASITAPANNSSFSAGSTVNISAAANDSDGTVALVEFYSDGQKLGEDPSSPYQYSWSNVPGGHHFITARVTDSQGAGSESQPVEIFVNETGGSLAGSLAGPPALPGFVDLTAAGTADWTHWGLTTNSPFNHKATGGSQISDYTVIGARPVELYFDNYTAFSWSDGTPAPSANNVAHGVFVMGVANGFEITAPADATSRTLTVYVGLYGAQGNFQAWLSDFSAPAFTSTTLSNSFDNAYGRYTMTYHAASAGQQLHVRYRSLNLFDQDFGNVTLQAATLTGVSSGNTPPTVTWNSPANGASFLAGSTITLTASANDSDGSVTNVEFLNGATTLGHDISSPYSYNWDNVLAGTYFLSARATDNHGATGVSTTITITVTNSAPQPVTLVSPFWPGGIFIFSFASQAGRSYEAQSIDVLGSGSWQTFKTITGNGGLITVTNYTPAATGRFYRVESK